MTCNHRYDTDSPLRCYRPHGHDHGHAYASAAGPDLSPQEPDE